MKSINGKKRVLLSLLGMALSLVFVPLTKNIWILYILWCFMTRSQNTPSIIQKDLDGDEWRVF